VTTMEDDWEEEQLAPIDPKFHEPPKLKWEDEEVDENDVKDSWEEEGTAFSHVFSLC
jgi:translation initiation factor 3 subunit J